MQVEEKLDGAGGGSRETVPVSLMSKWVRQGVDNAVATQRIVLDLAMRQNATTIDALRSTLSPARSERTEGLGKLAGECVSNFVEAERILLDLAMQQNEIVMKGAGERVPGAGAAMLVGVLRRSVETFIEMQQQLLSLADKQAGLARTGKSGRVKTVTDFIRDGIEQLVRSQKKLLDVVAEEAKKEPQGAKAKAEQRKAAPADLAELVRQSADAFIAMQKKLPEVAERQVETNMKAARRAAVLVPSARLDLAELTKQYVGNLVSFEESLLGILAKPRSAEGKEKGRAASPRAAGRRARRVAGKVAPKPEAAV